MQHKQLETNGMRSYVLVFENGEEFMAPLQAFAEDQELTAAQFTAIGAFSEATLGFFDMDRKDYIEIPIQEQVEVLALIGNIAYNQGKPKIHAHVVLGKIDGSAHGGHILRAVVRPTLEVMLNEAPQHLHRSSDPATGLALLSL